MREILIVSGVTGSGKTTLVRQLITEVQDRSDLGGDKPWTATVSADDFFEGPDGYAFNPSLLGEAHGQCLRRFTELLVAKVSPDTLIVDNTNTTTEELAPYVLLANAYKIPVRLITVTTPYDLELAAKRNVHGVPIQAIRAQSDRLDKRELPAFWMLREAVAMPKSCGDVGGFWIDDIGVGI